MDILSGKSVWKLNINNIKNTLNIGRRREKYFNDSSSWKSHVVNNFLDNPILLLFSRISNILRQKTKYKFDFGTPSEASRDYFIHSSNRDSHNLSLFLFSVTLPISNVFCHFPVLTSLKLVR